MRPRLESVDDWQLGPLEHFFSLAHSIPEAPRTPADARLDDLFMRHTTSVLWSQIIAMFGAGAKGPGDGVMPLLREHRLRPGSRSSDNICSHVTSHHSFTQ